jgi:hypothetical protein
MGITPLSDSEREFVALILAKLLIMKRPFLVLIHFVACFILGSLSVHAQDEKPIPGSYLKGRFTVFGSNNVKDWEATSFVYDKYVSEIVQIWGNNGRTSFRAQLNKPAPGKTDTLNVTDLCSWTDEQFNMYMSYKGTTFVKEMNDQWISGYIVFNAKDNRSGKSIYVDMAFRIPNPKSFKK